MVAAWDIYAEQLLPLGYGHPLWVPEPGVESGEVRIGDVGYLRAGGFRFMFNSTHNSDDPINRRMGVPSEFRAFDPPEQMFVRRPNEIMQTQLHSSSLRSNSVAGVASVGSSGALADATLRYQCSESSGAVLLLRRPAHYEFLDSRLRIKTYMLENFSRWLEFANSTLGIGLQDKEILFVSGYIKTADWAEAAFHSRGSSGELSITGGFSPVSGEFSVSMLRCDSPALFYRSGPTRSPGQPPLPSDGSIANETFDQCAFLHYYKMKNRRLWPTIRAAAEPQDLPRDPGDRGDSLAVTIEDHASCSDIDDVECVGSLQSYDPVGCLLDYIFEYSHAVVAFASVSDVLDVVSRSKYTSGDVVNALKSVMPRVVVDGNGVGSIEPSSCYPPSCSSLADFSSATHEQGLRGGITQYSSAPLPCSPSLGILPKATAPLVEQGPSFCFPLRARKHLWDLAFGDNSRASKSNCASHASPIDNRQGKSRNLRSRRDSFQRLRNSPARVGPMNSCSPVSMPLFWFLTPSHANHLFEIFYDMFNIHCPVLDPEVHTVPFTIARCPTLFTLVCTLASRCDASAASLYAMIVNETKRVAQRALLSDSRSMELARAYILMASYDGDATIGGRDQRLYLKIAIRIVHSLTVHLDYHSRPRTDDEERERVNKERLWLMCYILDRSSTIGFDRKPEIMEDEIIRYSANWYKGSVMNVNSDIRISAHVQLLRLLSQFCDTVYTKSSPMSIEQNIDVSAMAYNYQEQLDRLHEELEERFLQDTDFTETAEAFNFSLLTFLVDYSKLIIWSTASLHRPNPCMAEKCYRCAKAVILRMVDILAPTGYMKSSPNVIFLQATAAAAYLAKLTVNNFKSRTAEVLSLLTRLATCFSSPHVALDDLHTPAIHACHLAAIVQDLTHCHGPATTGSKYPHDNLTFDTTNLSGQEFFPMHITT